MTKEESLEYLSEGHDMWSVEIAKEICESIGVPFKDILIMRWTGQKDANPNNDPKGLWLNEDKPGEGVPSFRLSNYVANYLDLVAHDFFGRGSQARENARVIREHLKI